MGYVPPVSYDMRTYGDAFAGGLGPKDSFVSTLFGVFSLIVLIRYLLRYRKKERRRREKEYEREEKERRKAADRAAKKRSEWAVSGRERQRVRLLLLTCTSRITLICWL